MSRTLKDKKPIYRRDDEPLYHNREEPQMRRRFLNFIKSGPPLDGEKCPECGGLTNFQDGYITCCECGWIEDIVELCDMQGFAV